MILVRLVFQAKFGRAADLATAFMQFGGMATPSAISGARRVRLLTDLSGSFDTVVQEIEFDSFDAWQQSQAALFADPHAQALMASTRDLIAGGYKEFYTVEASTIPS
jgi:hypothetical protein